MRHHHFQRWLRALEELTPAQVEDAQILIGDVRRRTEAISEIEARVSGASRCPHCGDERRQKWGRTRTKVQRYRCGGCMKSYSGRTGSRIERIHRPDLFMAMMRDMFGSRRPLSVRKLASRLGVNKYTVWRWRIIILAALSGDPSGGLSGIIEADETHQRESRKGSREWVRHQRDPSAWPLPPRPRWYDYTTWGVKQMRGLSRWQLPILTVADRSGRRCFQRLADRRSATVMQALQPLVPVDAVLCSDGAASYALFTKQSGIEHFVLGSKPGQRMASPSHHIQNVNSLHARYDDFIKPFRGPATKYLDGYIKWFVNRLSPFEPTYLFRTL